MYLTFDIITSRMQPKKTTSKKRVTVAVLSGTIIGLVVEVIVFIFMSLGGMAAQNNAEANQMALTAVVIGLVLGLLVATGISWTIAKEKSSLIWVCFLLIFITIVVVGYAIATEPVRAL
jgi:uncharacterized protein YacL